MGWESYDVVRFDLGFGCLSGGYRFALVLQCLGLVGIGMDLQK